MTTSRSPTNSIHRNHFAPTKLSPTVPFMIHCKNHAYTRHLLYSRLSSSTSFHRDSTTGLKLSSPSLPPSPLLSNLALINPMRTSSSSGGSPDSRCPPVRNVSAAPIPSFRQAASGVVEAMVAAVAVAVLLDAGVLEGCCCCCRCRRRRRCCSGCSRSSGARLRAFVSGCRRVCSFAESIALRSLWSSLLAAASAAESLLLSASAWERAW